ncbi:MAG: DUF192 domain-containing protein [Bacteriovoracaceae bacterium]|nr:DUF192 domain-containing protein [Bacteriovoracaceae bacterium]
MKKYYFLLLVLVLNLTSCGKGDSRNSPQPQVESPAATEETKDPLKNVELISPSGEIIKVSIAYTSRDQSKGLQGVQPEEFEENEGKLFFYLKDSARTFWMPNTYFNLDIIYLDQELKITDIVWNIEHYTGSVDSEIPRAPRISSRHVLEMKNGSVISSKLKVGDQFQWKSPLTLQQTESKIRQQQ